MGFLLKFACAFIVFLTVVYYLAFGLLITSMGIYIKEVLYTTEPYVNQQEYVYAATIFITVGVVMLLIGLTGICALVTKKFYVSLLFTTFLTVILFSEISLSLTVYIMIEEIKSFFLNWLPAISLYNVSADMNIIWDFVQMGCKCCGLRNSTDWKRVVPVMPIPKYCYHYTDGGLKLSEIGCVEGCENVFKENLNDFANVGVTFMILQLTGIISACSLTRMYRKRCKL